MRLLTRLSYVAIVLVPVPISSQQSDALAPVAWMSGCWEGRSGSRVVSEMWLPPAGGLMIGGGRTVLGPTARAFEHLRLRAVNAQVVYTAIPSGQRETDFTATSVTSDSLVVANPQHDFPQRIIYRRVAPDSMVVRVEGPGDGGQVRGFSTSFGRVPCDRAPAR